MSRSTSGGSFPQLPPYGLLGVPKFYHGGASHASGTTTNGVVEVCIQLHIQEMDSVAYSIFFLFSVFHKTCLL